MDRNQDIFVYKSKLVKYLFLILTLSLLAVEIGLIYSVTESGKPDVFLFSGFLLLPSSSAG